MCSYDALPTSEKIFLWNFIDPSIRSMTTIRTQKIPVTITPELQLLHSTLSTCWTLFPGHIYHPPIIPNSRGIRNPLLATPANISASALAGLIFMLMLGFGGSNIIGVRAWALRKSCANLSRLLPAILTYGRATRSLWSH